MPLDNATRGAITFCRPDLMNAGNYLNVQESLAETIIVGDEPGMMSMTDDKCLIVVDDPYKRFIEVCQHFWPIPRFTIHHTAWIDRDTTELGENVTIGANAVVQHAVIGDNVTIYPGAVIGTDGFGFSHDNREPDGALIRFPHYGNVVIEDNVEVGANAVIDRGTLGSTIIRKGVKIDNLVHVAHNADIGEHTALVAHSMIAGSVTVGAGSWIAPHVAIRDRKTVGKDVLAGLGAVIVSDVADGQTVVGLPAKALEVK
jgi:UDP-3-O-[3-hydroxymyristoyl] glucosamine N-acyltransferase